jgi:hypothetical protein
VTILVIDLQHVITSDDDTHDVGTHSNGLSVSVPKTDQLRQEGKLKLKPIHEKKLTSVGSGSFFLTLIGKIT